MSLLCYQESCSKLLGDECTEAIHLRSQADTVKNPEIKPAFTRQGLTIVIENFRLEMASKCGGGDIALMLAIDYATNILDQMPE